MRRAFCLTILVIWILDPFATVGQAPAPSPAASAPEPIAELSAQRAADERGGRIELVAPFVAKL